MGTRRIVLIFISSININTAAVTFPNELNGKDNWGNDCSIAFTSFENWDGELANRTATARINYLPDDWQLTYGTLTRVTGEVVYLADQLSGLIAGHSLMVKLDDNGLPLSFFYFDNSGTGFKRRSFECKF